MRSNVQKLRRAGLHAAAIMLSLGFSSMVLAADQFLLTAGRGKPVCEAYLQLLNKTNFEYEGMPVTPFCGRPDGGNVEGFTTPERRYLTAKEIFKVSAEVHNFMLYSGHPPAFKDLDFASVEEVEETMKQLHSPHVWTYAKPIDIENDGQPKQLLIWQGYGALAGGGICGFGAALVRPIWWYGIYTQQRAFVLQADADAIDVKATADVFGAYNGYTSEDAKSGAIARAATENTPQFHVIPFHPIADSIGVFTYRGISYIETENRPAKRMARLPPVQVFLHKSGKTTRECVLRPIHVPGVQ